MRDDFSMEMGQFVPRDRAWDTLSHAKRSECLEPAHEKTD